MGVAQTTGNYLTRSALEDAILLSRASGMKLSQVADLTGVSIPTVWKVLRAHGIIHERIKSYSIRADLSGVSLDPNGELTQLEALDGLIEQLEAQRVTLRANLFRARSRRANHRNLNRQERSS